MRRNYVRAAFGLVQAAAVTLAFGAALADDTSGYTTADGLTVYYAVIPAEIVRMAPTGSVEATMHGGVPHGKHVHHLTVALFEGKSMERVTDAKLTARFQETGLGWEKKQLEPFVIADALTYGNYFTFSNFTNYKIDIEIRRPGSPDVITAEFTYRHH